MHSVDVKLNRLVRTDGIGLQLWPIYIWNHNHRQIDGDGIKATQGDEFARENQQIRFMIV